MPLPVDGVALAEFKIIRGGGSRIKVPMQTIYEGYNYSQGPRICSLSSWSSKKHITESNPC